MVTAHRRHRRTDQPKPLATLIDWIARWISGGEISHCRRRRTGTAAPAIVITARGLSSNRCRRRCWASTTPIFAASAPTRRFIIISLYSVYKRMSYRCRCLSLPSEGYIAVAGLFDIRREAGASILSLARAVFAGMRSACGVWWAWRITALGSATHF